MLNRPCACSHETHLSKCDTKAHWWFTALCQQLFSLHLTQRCRNMYLKGALEGITYKEAGHSSAFKSDSLFFLLMFVPSGTETKLDMVLFSVGWRMPYRRVCQPVPIGGTSAACSSKWQPLCSVTTCREFVVRGRSHHEGMGVMPYPEVLECLASWECLSHPIQTGSTLVPQNHYVVHVQGVYREL